MKTPKKYSKKAKKVVKKYDIGGPIGDEEDVMDPNENNDLNNSDSNSIPDPIISSEAKNAVNNTTSNLFGSPKGVAGMGIAANSVGQIGAGLINSNVKVNSGVKSFVGSNGKQVISTNNVGKNVIGKDIASTALSRAGQGAAIGSAFGPYGLAIGAAAGAVEGSVEGSFKGKKDKKALQQQASSELEQANALGSGSAYGYKKGGKIKYQDGGNVGTKLDSLTEKKYQDFKKTLPKNLQYEGDYDLRGFYKENPKFNVTDPEQHLTDKYKLPNHPTFSIESMYSTPENPGGSWDGDKFIPPIKKANGGGIGVALGPGTEATIAKRKKKLEFAKGGKIEGSGTAKSDSIDAEVEQGSFIVPAENAKVAEKLRAKYFGNEDKKAKLKDGGGVDVMLSNGEHMFSPEEVKVLKSNGVDVDGLAPNADNKDAMKAGGMVKKKFTIKKKMQDGGEVDEEEAIDNDEEEQKETDAATENEDAVDEIDSEESSEDDGYKKGGKVKKKKYAEGGTTEDNADDYSFNPSEDINTDVSDEDINTLKNTKIADKTTEEDANTIALQKSLVGVTPPIVGSDKPKDINPSKKIFDALGGVAGIASLGQTGLGLTTLFGSKRPVGQVDSKLLNQQSEALRESKTGLSPEEQSVSRQDIENTRRADVRNIVGLSGGSSGTALSNIGAAGSRANRGLLDLGVNNARMKMSKQSRADQLTSAVAREKRQLVQDQLNAFNVNQQAAAGLTQAGLSNFFGNLDKKDYNKQLAEINSKYETNGRVPQFDPYTGKPL